MPTYDYICDDCDIEFELFQSMSDEPIRICPHCSGVVRRLIGSGSGLIFNGSGYYLTDYKNKPKPVQDIKKPIKSEENKTTKVKNDTV